DVLVVQGTEAGGHCGEVSTMVLVPEVIRAVKPMGNVPVLAAGGIMTGAQMAAAMAMGAAGVWTGSVWLATPGSGPSDVRKAMLVEGSGRDAVRSRTRAGKPWRQRRSSWSEAWGRSPESPGALPMALMWLFSEVPVRSALKAAGTGDTKARDMATYLV